MNRNVNRNSMDNDKFVTTYYVRDPQGNVLAVYEHKRGESGNGTFTLTEQHLYGAGRLGMRKRDLALNVANASEPTPVTHYELTNHLGNVMAVISDKASDTNEPTVVSLSDYYPFGMEEPGRSYSESDDYRYGYTGHEKESDLAEGVYTTEYRLLDTRLGRWLSVDPLFAKYPGMSSYNYCAGNPMILVDYDGRSHNGGFCIKNNTKKTLTFTNCSGLNMTTYTLWWGHKTNLIDKYEEVSSDRDIKLEPGQMLEPYIKEYNIITKEGAKRAVYEFRSRIIAADGVTVVEDNLLAYDVDCVKVEEGLTFNVEGKRYNSNESDVDAETPKTRLGINKIKLQPSENRALSAEIEEMTRTRTSRTLEVKSGTIEFRQEEESDDIKIITEDGIPFISKSNIEITESIKHNGEKK